MEGLKTAKNAYKQMTNNARLKLLKEEGGGALKLVNCSDVFCERHLLKFAAVS